MARVQHWLEQRAWYLRPVILICIGVLCATGQAPWGWWPVSVLSFALALALICPAPRARRAFSNLFFVGLGYFGFALQWIVSPFLVDAATHGWMAPFALLLMASGAALFWGLAGGLAHRIAPRSGLFLALMLVSVEVARSLILSGFPWALIGHIWIETPLAQLAAFGGPHLLSLGTALLAWSLVQLAARHWAAGGVVVIAAALWGVTSQLDSPNTQDAPMIRLVQPNAPQDEKWDPEKRQFFFDRMLGFSAMAPRPDLIVWPETAVPQLMDYAQPAFDRMIAAAGGVPVVTGINRSNGPLYHNSFVVLDGEGYVSAIYDKAHLVPFGEFIPGRALLARLSVAPLNSVAEFTPGRDQGLVELPGIGKARALICYEGIFAEEIATKDRPRLMVLITNDAWFGPGLGPQQHLVQARWRAIEQGLPMVRVANTGISAMIDARGRITGQIDLNRAGYLDLPLPPALPATLYTGLGDWPLVVILLFIMIGVATQQRQFL